MSNHAFVHASNLVREDDVDVLPGALVEACRLHHHVEQVLVQSNLGEVLRAIPSHGILQELHVFSLHQ